MGSSNAPIVILDSGLGGLTVVQAIRRVMPNEQIIYFGDTARLPYGSKTAGTVTAFVRQIIHYLEPFGPKHVVIACNTASALALPAIHKDFPQFTITGVIEPGARAAVRAVEGITPAVVGVIGTEATIRSRAYGNAIQKIRGDVKVVTRATPLLVPIIEEGRPKADPLVRLALQQYLQPILEQNASALVLGCTHYPIFRSLVCEMVGEKVRVIDSAAQCAQDVYARLQEHELLRGTPLPAAEPWLRCFVTDDSPRFATLASRFLGVTIREPVVVAPDLLYAGMVVSNATLVSSELVASAGL